MSAPLTTLAAAVAAFTLLTACTPASTPAANRAAAARSARDVYPDTDPTEAGRRPRTPEERPVTPIMTQ